MANWIGSKNQIAFAYIIESAEILGLPGCCQLNPLVWRLHKSVIWSLVSKRRTWYPTMMDRTATKKSYYIDDEKSRLILFIYFLWCCRFVLSVVVNHQASHQANKMSTYTYTYTQRENCFINFLFLQLVVVVFCCKWKEYHRWMTAGEVGSRESVHILRTREVMATTTTTKNCPLYIFFSRKCNFHCKTFQLYPWEYITMR
jgi:hypothetical protein